MALRAVFACDLSLRWSETTEAICLFTEGFATLSCGVSKIYQIGIFMLCPNCSNDCSERAISCPQCGEPFSDIIPPIEKTHAALFAFFLGGLGIHDFVLGNPTRGVLKIVLNIFGFLIVPAFVCALLIYLDLRHITKGTYSTKTKKLTGDDSVALALSIIYLVFFILGILGIIAFSSLFFLPTLTAF
ncbi:MAG: TM2 domain-containing protein [Fibrobacteraceae bacterium]|nr:TM2 domain-containing protein [Fibrobacteraceae bacterium]